MSRVDPKPPSRSRLPMDRAAVLPRRPGPIELRGRPPPAPESSPASGRDHPARPRRRRCAGSSRRRARTPQTASYTVRSSASVNVGPTNAVAMPVSSRSMRTRSTASRTIRAWSNASSIFPSSTSDTGTSAACRGVGTTGDVTHLAQHREVADRHHVHPGVAAGIAVGAELAQRRSRRRQSPRGAPGSPPRRASRWGA